MESATVTQSELRWAKTLWNYMKLNDKVERSDLILALGSYDVRVAERAAQLWLDGMAETIMFSGNTGILTRGLWEEPEAEVFRKRALQMGVPEDRIIIESRSRNTGENIQMSFKTLQDLDKLPESIILVQKPYMERRSYATFMKQWPGDASEVKLCVTSPAIEIEAYPNDNTGSICDVISVLVGDMERISLYEKLGFQIPQHVPDYVQKDFEALKSTGKYASHLPN